MSQVSQEQEQLELKVLRKLDEAVDALAELLGDGPKEEVGLIVPMYIDLDKIHSQLGDIYVDWLKRRGFLTEDGSPTSKVSDYV